MGGVWLARMPPLRMMLLANEVGVVVPVSAANSPAELMVIVPVPRRLAALDRSWTLPALPLALPIETLPGERRICGLEEKLAAVERGWRGKKRQCAGARQRPIEAEVSAAGAVVEQCAAGRADRDGCRISAVRVTGRCGSRVFERSTIERERAFADLLRRTGVC